MEPQLPNTRSVPRTRDVSVEHRVKRWRDIGFFTDVDLTHLPPGQQRQIVKKAFARVEKRWPVRLAGPLLLVALIAGFSLTGFIHFNFLGRFQTALPLIVTGVLSFAFAIAIVIFILSRMFKRLLRPHIWQALDSLCSTCGYDLTANTSGICPECGRAIERGSRPEGEESDAHADKGAR